MPVLAELSLYTFVLFIHVLAVVTAFGITFAYPILFTVARRMHPSHLAYLHRAQEPIGRYLITGSAVVILAAGLYLVADGPYGFDDHWLTGALAILIVILGLGGAVFAPTERKALAALERDLAAAGDGEPVLSEEYERLARRIERTGMLSSALIVVAIFLMVVKPGA
jgi:uncharacterized membrane protein